MRLKNVFNHRWDEVIRKTQFCWRKQNLVSLELTMFRFFFRWVGYVDNDLNGVTMP